MSRRTPRRSLRRQHGAVAVFAAIALIAGLTATMLAVEVGRMYTSHRDLAKLASMAALDGARIVGGCDRANAPTSNDVRAEISQSLTRNGATELDTPTNATIGLGFVTTQNGIRRLQATPADEATAVGVTLTRPFPQPFLPLIPSTDRDMTASAVATQEIIGVLTVGTSLLTIDSSRSAALNSVVSGLLGGAVNLSALGYQGLASTSVTLADLALAAGVANPGDLLALETTLPGALQILGDALEAGGEAGQAQAADTLAGLVTLVDPDRNTILLGDVLQVEDGLKRAVGELPINTLELFMALSQNAAAGYPLNLPLSVTLPSGLGGVTVQARIGAPGSIAFGRPGFLENGTARTQATTSQVFLEISANVLDLDPIDDLIPLLSILSIPNGSVLNVHLTVEIAQATATLTEVHCAYSQRAQHEVAVEVETAVATVSVGTFSNIASANPQVVSAPALLQTGVLGIRANQVLDHQIAATVDEVEFTGPFVPKVSAVVAGDHVASVGGDVSQTLDGTVSSLSSQLGQNLQYTGAIGLLISALGPAAELALLDTLLSPVWDLLDTVLETVLDALGIQLGAATVTIQSVDINPPVVFEK